MSLHIAIDYERNWYSTAGNVLGARAASEGFLQAVLRYASAESFAGYSVTPADLTAFGEQAERIRPGGNYRLLNGSNSDALATCDVLYRGDPNLGNRAFQRRSLGDSAYCLTGVTHTLCSQTVLKYLAELWSAPLQPWDAVVCTSQVAVKVIREQREMLAEYYVERGGKLPPQRFELPLIPLGVDAPYFAKIGQDALRRKTQRAALGIASDAVCFLYFGRLSFHAKANPLPMFQALEQAAQQTGKKVHLILAGWFASPGIEKAFRRVAAEFAPHVGLSIVDGGRSDVHQVWSAADVFISLADNIQETFGLTPLEAMAAGVPVIASDWDGYRETVRHEVDGLLIPTYTPPAGSGAEFARRHFVEADNYDHYIAGVSQSTAVDANAAAAACVRLIDHPELRKKFGESGQSRVREKYAWPVVMQAYMALWEELNRRRLAAPPIPAAKFPVPWFADPFHTFAHYPTAQFHPGTTFALTPFGREVQRDAVRLEAVLQDTLLRHVKTPEYLLEQPAVAEILNLLTAGPLAAEKLITPFPVAARVWKTLGWLVKVNLLAVEMNS